MRAPLGLGRLRRLELLRCGVTDEVLYALGEAVQRQAVGLQHCDLSHNRISDAGFSRLLVCLARHPDCPYQRIDGDKASK